MAHAVNTASLFRREAVHHFHMAVEVMPKTKEVTVEEFVGRLKVSGGVWKDGKRALRKEDGDEPK